MRRRPTCRKLLCAVILSLLLTGALSAAEAPPTFTKMPTAVKSGDKLKIDFAVDRNTDVAVYIEDAQGKVIRHLAGGVLGKNAPEPLQSNALAQSLEWDGKDNCGKAAAGGPRDEEGQGGRV